MPLASPRPKKVGHEHPVRQVTGISFDLKVYGKSLQTQAIYAKTASTECQRAGWGWKNSDAPDTQLQPRRALVQAAGTSKVILRWALSLQHPLCNLTAQPVPSPPRQVRGSGDRAPLLCYYWATEAGRDIGPSKHGITLVSALSKSSLKFMLMSIALGVLLYIPSYAKQGELVVKCLLSIYKVLGSIPRTFPKLMYLSRHSGSHLSFQHSGVKTGGTSKV